jgi:hypothetical protein
MECDETTKRNNYEDIFMSQTRFEHVLKLQQMIHADFINFHLFQLPFLASKASMDASAHPCYDYFYYYSILTSC